MSHSVGLPGVEPESGVTANDMLYLERHIGALEAMAPVWTPGASCHYHPITYGSLLDEVVRRVTGKSVAQVFAEEIAAPLGLDFWIGLPAERGAARRPALLADARPQHRSDHRLHRRHGHRHRRRASPRWC